MTIVWLSNYHVKLFLYNKTSYPSFNLYAGSCLFCTDILIYCRNLLGCFAATGIEINLTTKTCFTIYLTVLKLVLNAYFSRKLSFKTINIYLHVFDWLTITKLALCLGESFFHFISFLIKVFLPQIIFNYVGKY